jgi:hypothetical protein
LLLPVSKLLILSMPLASGSCSSRVCDVICTHIETQSLLFLCSAS